MTPSDRPAGSRPVGWGSPTSPTSSDDPDATRRGGAVRARMVTCLDPLRDRPPP